VILSAETTVHDLLAGCPELRPYVEALLPPADPGIGDAGAAKRHRLTTVADVARGANLTQHELLRDLQAEAARLGVADRVVGAGAGASSLEEADGLEALVGQLEQGRDLLELAAVVRRLGLDAHRGASAGPHRTAPEESSGRGGVTEDGRLTGAGGVRGSEPGHPLDTMRREIEAAEQVLRMLRSAVEAMEREPAEWGRVRPLVFRLLDLLEGLERHYRRAVELVCPHLGRHGRGELGRLLFEVQSDVMRLLSEVRRDVEGGAFEAATVACRRLLEAATQSLRQEEYLLLPVAEATLGEAEWRVVRAGEAEIGWALIDAPPPWPARP
jgi:hypothetical protein